MKSWLYLERDILVNWRPRKTNLDSFYLDLNPESIVFFSDIKDVVELIDVTDFKELSILLAIFIEVLGL